VIERRGLEIVETERLALWRPSLEDLAELFAIQSDPRVWWHYPSLRLSEPAQTRAGIERWLEGWRTNGLDRWVIRLRNGVAVIGYGGCSVRGPVWNLGYRLAPAAHGRGYATEFAAAAMRHALEVDADRPIVARVLEHNVASERVVVKLGMSLVYRGPDEGHPSPSAVRRIYADRPLTAEQLAGVVA
jgi:RimJ/RimL family protein N-acetyltransferase